MLPDGPGDRPRSGGLESSPLFSNMARRFLTWLIARAGGLDRSSFWERGGRRQLSRSRSRGKRVMPAKGVVGRLEAPEGPGWRARVRVDRGAYTAALAKGVKSIID